MYVVTVLLFCNNVFISLIYLEIFFKDLSTVIGVPTDGQPLVSCACIKADKADSSVTPLAL